MTRTRVWYGLTLLAGGLGPLAWWPMAEPVSQATDNMTSFLLLPVMIAVAVLIAAFATPAVGWRHRLGGALLAFAGLAAWVAWAMSQPITRLF